MRATAANKVHDLAKRDSRVLFIGSDLGAGMLEDMRAEMPDRYFMEGVQEANIVGMAAGLAMDGYVPYVNTIATFFVRRALEQIAIDLCLHNLPVRLVANGGGLVYAPLGPTHMAIEDLALMRALPNMTVLAPCDAAEMAALMDQTLDVPGPVYVRCAKGGDVVVSDISAPPVLGRATTLREGRDVVLLTTGIMAARALSAADILVDRGVECGVFHFHTVKPLDVELLSEIGAHAELVVTLEEHVGAGGFGSAVCEAMIDANAGMMPRTLRMALPDAFPDDYGSQEHLLKQAGLDPDQIANRILEFSGDNLPTK